MASTIAAELKKLDAAAKKAVPQEGSGQLPDGQYRGIITKGSIDLAREGKAMSATWRVRVTEGDMKGSSGRINQNIRKKDGTPNDTGLSIVKGILTQIHGDEVLPSDSGTGSWDKLMSDSVGAGIQFQVYTKDDNSNTRVQAIFPKTEDGESTEAVTQDAEEPEAEATEPEAEAEEPEEEPEEAMPTPKGKKAKAVPAPEPEETEEQKLDRLLTEKVEAGDRTWLKKFIADNQLKIQVMKGWTEQKIADLIRKELLETPEA